MNDLRGCSGTEPDLMNLRRLDSGRTNTLVAEQLVRGGLLIVIPLAIVENVLMMISTVLVIIQGLGLAGVDLRKRWLRLVVLGITGWMREGTGRWCRGWFIWLRCGGGRCGCGGGSC